MKNDSSSKLSKAVYVINEVLDERGRFITPSEFKWIMDYFKDRYDPRRLAFALMYTCGLRSEDGCKARLKWFTQDFKYLQMSQCKAHVRKKDGVIKAKMKPRFMPLPEWLSADLRNYILYRNMMGWYVGENIDERMLLFPKLRQIHLRDLFCKLRQKHGSKEKWLMDIWQIVRGFDSEQNLIWERKYFRIACHSPRASFCTAAYEICNRDLMATKLLSGHSNTTDLERYVKVSGLMEKKQELTDRHMEIIQPLTVPLTKDQKLLGEYGFKKPV